jgi:hypothetical protein
MPQVLGCHTRPVAAPPIESTSVGWQGIMKPGGSGVRINMARPSRPGEDARQCSTALGCEHKPLGFLLNEPCRLEALDGNPLQPALTFA